MKGRQPELAFHAAEGVFHPDESDVELPQVLIFEFKGAAEVVASMQFAAVLPIRFPCAASLGFVLQGRS